MIASWRRSLSNVGGNIDEGGNRDVSRALAHAIDVVPTTSANAPDRAHVHGFHAYPARLHPVTAKRLIESFSSKGDIVFDPFCGSGTVLVEAMLAGRRAIGTDLNPLAVMLARSKTHVRSPEQISALVFAAKDVSAFADACRKRKSGASRRLAREDVAVFAPHVLLELDSLRTGIELAPPAARPDLQLVLSSILVKLSQKRGDTSNDAVDKRIGQGYPARLFVHKTEEFARRLSEFGELAKAASALSDPNMPAARVMLDDARTLRKLDTASVDTVITSPPYVATYNYIEHHAMRMRWLGLSAHQLAKGELGSRRHYAELTPSGAKKAWARELGEFLSAIVRVTRKGANVIVLLADSATGRGPRDEEPLALRADELVADVAAHLQSLVPVARASQVRAHYHSPTSRAFRDRPRMEHALLLRCV
ncbi:MAG: site-specific DNA-methyltransferase [Polyangiaceae bacterium]|nr:site-specific DNA-methyltransferase [Polyangiaceae bacterium]